MHTRCSCEHTCSSSRCTCMMPRCPRHVQNSVMPNSPAQRPTPRHPMRRSAHGNRAMPRHIVLKEPWQQSHALLHKFLVVKQSADYLALCFCRVVANSQTGKQFRHLGHEGRLSWHAHEEDRRSAPKHPQLSTRMKTHSLPSPVSLLKHSECTCDTSHDPEDDMCPNAVL